MNELKRMHEPGEALARILGHVRSGPPETVRIEDALGRALGAPVHARRTLPPWNNSAMDGYAVRAADLGGPGVTLRQVAEVAAGGSHSTPLGPGECARIFTGAPLPPGADTVVMQEKVRAEGGRIELQEVPAPGANVRAAGEDARAGELLLPAGTSLGIPEVGLLWAQGLTMVTVARAPRVALFSTGDELCAVGQAEGDRIVDTNTPGLALAVRRAGGVPTVLPIARDTLEEVVARFRETDGFDVVITSAGVSVGDRDFVRPALEAIGVEMDFWRVAIKPGKPLAVGTRGSTLYVGLPGNPASSLVTFELFVRPALRRWCGHTSVEPARLGGVMVGGYRKAAGLTHYVRATVEFREGALYASPLSTQTSGTLRSTATATHLIEVPPQVTEVSPGQPVTLLPVSWAA